MDGGHKHNDFENRDLLGRDIYALAGFCPKCTLTPRNVSTRKPESSTKVKRNATLLFSNLRSGKIDSPKAEKDLVFVPTWDYSTDTEESSHRQWEEHTETLPSDNGGNLEGNMPIGTHRASPDSGCSNVSPWQEVVHTAESSIRFGWTFLRVQAKSKPGYVKEWLQHN